MNVRIDEVAAAEMEDLSDDEEDKVIRAEEEEEKEKEVSEGGMDGVKSSGEKMGGMTFYYWPILPHELCRRWEVKKAIM